MSEPKIVVCPQCGKKYKLSAEFAAASFQCKACSATVWVKKPTQVESKRRRPGRGGGRAAARGGRGRAAATTRGGRSRQEEPADEGGGRRRYERPKSNANLFIAIGGLVVVIGLVAFVLSSKKGDATNVANAGSSERDVVDDGGGDTATKGGDTNKGAESAGPAKKAGGDSKSGTAKVDPKEAGGDAKPGPKGTDDVEEGPRPSKKLGATPKGRKGGAKSKWDPPPDIPHLKETTPEEAKKIDDLIVVMWDPYAGKDSLTAKQDLVLMDKKAFPRVLGKMAQTRDTMTDVDSLEERLVESSLKLADSCLREMDGYLETHGKSELKPGSTKRYVTYILRLHYRRWVKELSKMKKMPGPFDPASEYEKPEEFDGPRR